MKKLIMVLLVVLNIIALGAKEGLEAGDIFPKISLYDTDGELISSSDDYEGKITIYNFGASWCPPCKYEKPLLNKFYLDNSDEVSVVSIMVDNNPKDVDKFFVDNPVDFPHYFDRGQKLSNQFLIRVVPTTYVVDSDGIILIRLHGATEWNTVSVDDIKNLRN